MVGQLIHEHVRKRLRGIHIISILFVFFLFGLLYTMSYSVDVPTIEAQMILLGMGFILTLSYISLIPQREHAPMAPLFFFVLLNLMNSALVWATGVFQSPFIILYVILIIISAQLYHYIYGLLQTFLALVGIVFVYGATTMNFLEYHSLFPRSSIESLLQPAEIILLYSLMYAALLFFTALSSSSVRTLVFRPHGRGHIDMSYQEKIIHDMPIGVIVVDHELRLLSGNPYARIHFAYQDNMNTLLTDHLYFGKQHPHTVLNRLAKSMAEKACVWQLDNGSHIDGFLSVRTMGKTTSEPETYLIFLRTADHD